MTKIKVNTHREFEALTDIVDNCIMWAVESISDAEYIEDVMHHFDELQAWKDIKHGLYFLFDAFGDGKSIELDDKTAHVLYRELVSILKEAEENKYKDDVAYVGLTISAAPAFNIYKNDLEFIKGWSNLIKKEAESFKQDNYESYKNLDVFFGFED